MPKVRLLVPFTDQSGHAHAPGEEVEVDDATFADLRADGKASAIADEQAAAKRAAEGNYSARMTRDDAGGAKSEEKPKEKK